MPVVCLCLLFDMSLVVWLLFFVLVLGLVACYGYVGWVIVTCVKFTIWFGLFVIVVMWLV